METMTAEEEKILQTYREMDADYRDMLMLVCKILSTNGGELITSVEMFSHNQAGDNSIIAIGGSVCTGRSEGYNA